MFYTLNSYRAIMYVPTVNYIYNVAHVHFTTCCSLLCEMFLICYFYLTKDHIGNKCFFVRFICYPLIKQLQKKNIIVSSADLTEYLIHPAWSAYSPANVDRCHISHGGMLPTARS